MGTARDADGVIVNLGAADPTGRAQRPSFW
jgi:hypothetical protein